MCKSQLFKALVATLLGFTCVSANAAFLGRLEATPGSGDYQAYYDTQLDVTWAADANINGNKSWDDQMTWVAGLTIDSVGGWRLANMDVNGDDVIVDCAAVSQAACKDSEYGHLRTYGAGTTAGNGVTSGNQSPFSNVIGNLYWSETEFVVNPNNAWYLNFFGTATPSARASIDKSSLNYAFAVQSGDIAAIPVPAAVWLFGSGLLGLMGLARKKA